MFVQLYGADDICLHILAATRDFQQCGILACVDSDEPAAYF